MQLAKLCVCVCKTTVFGNEELRPFLETQKLILTFIQTTDIGLKQRLMIKLYLFPELFLMLLPKTSHMQTFKIPDTLFSRPFPISLGPGI